ncbi:MAG: hypothetical protein V1797_09190 [Pseudomonadota bacterium]
MRGSRIWAGCLLVLGLACLGLTAALPFTLTSPVPGFVLMGLPALLAAAVCLLHGWTLLRLRLVIADGGIAVTAPAWRGFPCPPVRLRRLAWGEIKAVRRRQQRYHTGRTGSANGLTLLICALYSLETDEGPVILAQGALPGLAGHIQAICQRAGLELIDCPAVEVSTVQALLGREPAWPAWPARARPGPSAG